MVLKILPTISLFLAVQQAHGTNNKYPKNIAYGLLASVVGDAALVWDGLFVVGMLAFGLGHFFYIKALNLKGNLLGACAKKSFGKALLVYGLAFIVWYMLLFNGLKDEVLKF